MAIEYRVNPTGGLDKSNNPLAVSDKDFTDAVDITSINPNQLNDNQNLKLNNNADYAFDLGTLVAQAKKYRVTIDFTNITGADFADVDFIPSKGNAFYGTPATSSNEASFSVTIVSATTASSLYTAIVAAKNASVLNTATISNPDTSVSKVLSFDYECTPMGYTDYDFDVLGQTTNTINPTISVQVLQDALSNEKLGALKPIKYVNVGEYVFIFSTTGTEEELNYPISLGRFSVVNGGGYYLLMDGGQWILGEDEEVLLQGNAFTSSAPYNDLWAVSLLGTLEGSTIPPSHAIGFSNVSLTRYKRTASVIGVAYKNKATGEWTYTQLLCSTNLNFRTFKQLDVTFSTFDGGFIFDITDNLNVLRRFIYKGELVENGFLTGYNPSAIYNLDTIEAETRLQQGVNNAKVSLKVANQWIYGQAGEKQEGSYVVFVRFISDDGLQGFWSRPSNIVWTHSDTALEHSAGNTTTQSLRIEIEQIQTDLYTKYQIGIIQFNSDSWSSYMLPAEPINNQETIITFDTGFDDSIYIRGWASNIELEQLPYDFEYAKNILSYDNYVIASNYQRPAPYELTEWTETFTWSEAIGDIPNQFDYILNQQANWAGHAMNDAQVMSNEYMGYMPYEAVMFGIEVIWKEDYPPSKFFASIQTHTNTQVTDDGDPVVNLKYNYFKCTNINFDYQLVNGKRVRDLVKDFRFTRADITPVVKATGLGISTKSNTYPFTYGAYDALATPFFTVLHSPDMINTGNTFQFETGDTAVFGQLKFQQDANGYGISGSELLDYFGDYQTTIASLPVEAVQTLAAGQEGDFVNLNQTSPDYWHQGCIAIKTTGFPTNYVDKYFYWNIFYLKNVTDSYPLGNKAYKMFVIPQDKWYNAETHTPATEYSVFGGNTFTNKSYYKTDADNADGTNTTFAQIIGFYSFNKTNASLRSGYFPYWGILPYFQYSFADDVYLYDSCFQSKYPFQVSRPLSDDELNAPTGNPFTIAWSEKYLTSALQGNNRIWKIGNQKALEPNWGAINAMLIVNTRLLVLQDRKITSQYFNNSGKLITETSEVLLGTGAVLGIKGEDLSLYGTSHKWSVIKGKARNGSDVAYWFSYYGLKIMRYAGDGLTPISDAANLSSYLQIFTKYFDIADYNNADTPANNYGVHGVWNDMKKEAIWTFRGIVKHTTYSDAVTYGLNSWVIAETPTYFGFENVPVLYRSKVASNIGNDLTDTTYWEKYNYYNTESMAYFTLVWSEYENKFKCNFTFQPKIYGEYQNSYLSSHPTANNLTYEHNQDNNARYYCSVPELGGSNGFDVVNRGTYFEISSSALDENIAALFGVSTFPYYPTTELDNHIGYFLYIQDKFVRITEFATAYSVKVDINEPLENAEINEIYYSTCNQGQPMIRQVLNQTYPRYMNYAAFTSNVKYPPTKVEHKAQVDSDVQENTESYNEFGDFINYQGRKFAQIPMDITGGNDRKRGFNGVEGYYLEETIKFTPNIKTNLQDYSVIMVEQNKKVK
jgi:hypothetical protein